MVSVMRTGGSASNVLIKWILIKKERRTSILLVRIHHMQILKYEQNKKSRENTSCKNFLPVVSFLQCGVNIYNSLRTTTVAFHMPFLFINDKSVFVCVNKNLIHAPMHLEIFSLKSILWNYFFVSFFNVYLIRENFFYYTFE